MGNRKIIYVATCFALLQITGCSKTEEATQTSNEVANTSVGIDGYKSFKFGMSAIDVAKLPECVNSYRQSNGLYDGDEDYGLRNQLKTDEAELASAQQNINDQIDKLNKRIEAYDLDDDKQKLANLQGTSSPLAERQNKIANLKSEIDKVTQFSPESVDRWVTNSGGCEVEVFNEKTTLVPEFENGKLAVVEIGFGEFNDPKFQSIAKALSEKYDLSHTYTAEQQESFNQFQSDKISVTYALGQVALVALNTKKINSIGAISLDHRITYATDQRVMVLRYLDLTHAKAAEKDSTKGQVKSSDL